MWQTDRSSNQKTSPEWFSRVFCGVSIPYRLSVCRRPVCGATRKTPFIRSSIVTGIRMSATRRPVCRSPLTERGPEMWRDIATDTRESPSRKRPATLRNSHSIWQKTAWLGVQCLASWSAFKWPRKVVRLAAQEPRGQVKENPRSRSIDATGNPPAKSAQ